MATKLFVGSLPSLIDESAFVQLFEPYGQIVSSVCNADRRYGFVTYATMEEAQNAIHAMNGYSLNGACIVVKLADNQGGGPAAFSSNSFGGDGGGQAQSERIYVKGLPAGMTDDAVLKVFAAYGDVVDTKVLVSNGKSSDGQGQSVAIIRMGKVSQAAWLVEYGNGNIPQGLTNPVEISYASSQRQAPAPPAPPAPPPVPVPPRYSPYGGKGGPVHTGSYGVLPALPPTVTPTSRGGGGGGPGSDALIPNMRLMMQESGPRATLYVKGLPLGADDLYLYKAFAPFGCVLSAKALPKDGYVIGFVHYASEEQAEGAIMSLNGLTLTDGSTLQVAVKTVKA